MGNSHRRPRNRRAVAGVAISSSIHPISAAVCRQSWWKVKPDTSIQPDLGASPICTACPTTCFDYSCGVCMLPIWKAPKPSCVIPVLDVYASLLAASSCGEAERVIGMHWIDVCGVFLLRQLRSAEHAVVAPALPNTHMQSARTPAMQVSTSGLFMPYTHPALELHGSPCYDPARPCTSALPAQP